MSLHAIFSVSSSCFVRATITVSCSTKYIILEERFTDLFVFLKKTQLLVFKDDCVICGNSVNDFYRSFVIFRFPELFEDPDRQHHHHQCHHLYCGLPAPTAGHTDALTL